MKVTNVFIVGIAGKGCTVERELVSFESQNSLVFFLNFSLLMSQLFIMYWSSYFVECFQRPCSVIWLKIQYNNNEGSASIIPCLHGLDRFSLGEYLMSLKLLLTS